MLFSKVFSSFEALQFLPNTKLYIICKFCIIITIIFQRVFLMTSDNQQDNGLKFLMQILSLLLFFAFEYTFFWLFIKRKPHYNLQIFSILFLHLLFSQILTELTLLVLENSERKNTELVFQEIFFLNAPIVLFADSKILKGGLLVYIISISLLRITRFQNELFYIPWSMTVGLFLLFSIILACRKDNLSPKSSSIDTLNKYSKLDTAIEGVALINRDKEIFYMNGLFRGLMEASNEQEALQKIMKLQKLDSSSESAKKSYIQEIKLKNNSHSHHTRKRSMDLYAKRRARLTSIDCQKTGGVKSGGSTNQHRPLNFQHPTSSIAKAETAGTQEDKTLNNFGSIQSPLPTIKVSHAKDHDEDPKAVWNFSDSRYPLNHAGDSFAYNRESKGKYTSSPEEVDNIQPEQVALQIDMMDGITLRHDTVEANIDAAFESMNKNPDKTHNVLITQLVENLKDPLELLKGISPTSPTHAKGQESTTLEHSGKTELRVTFRDSKRGLRILEVVLCPFMYQNKECLCICVKDVSCEVKIEDAYETMEYKDKLLRFVSHEFRTPLNCSIALLEVLRNFVPEDLNEGYVNPALNSSKMLLNLANDILDHAQIQARKLKVNIKACNLKKVFEEVMEMMKMQALGKNNELALDWDSRIRQKFYTDPNRLQQILLNLVSNAMKYTSKGCVTLQAHYVSPVVCKISVIDTGVGISKPSVNMLFQEFGKIQENSHLNPHGIGLGLVISKLLTQELGPDGEGLMVDSEEGKGTVFYFLLESKLDSNEEEPDEIEEGDSLEENASAYINMIKTTYGLLDDLTPSKPSGRRKSAHNTENSEIISQKRGSFLGPVSFPNKDGLTPKMLEPPAITKTLMNLDNLSSGFKKESLDGVLVKMNRNVYSAAKEVQKDAPVIIHRSYTMQSKKPKWVKSNSEYCRFLKKTQHNCKSPKVLLVDDSMFNLKALQALMTQTLGVECKIAMDGQEAIDEVMKNEKVCQKCKNFKLIFMDVEMPTLNGYEATKILRKKMLEGEISFIPIIGITGHNPKENRVQCLTSGMNDMVAKPVFPEIIQQLLLKWMDP